MAEQGARDRTLAAFGGDGDAHQRLIIAFAVMAHFAHVKAAFLGQEGRVDHVHRVRIDAHQARQHGGGDGLLVQFGGMTFHLYRNAGDLVAFELADQAAQLLGDRHIGLELGRFLRRQAGDVERIGDAAVEQIVGQLFGDLQRHIDLRFIGRRTQMRGADEVGRAEQGRFLGRFGLEHVQRGARDMARIERVLERGLVDQPAACAVDDTHALLGLGQIFAAQYVAGLVGQRRVQRDEVGLRQQRVEIGLFHAHFDGAFRRQERVKGDDLHFQAQRAAGDDRADIARADQAQRLAGDFHAHEAVFRPQALLGLRIGFGNLARQREDQRDGMFSGGDRVAERRVHDDHALGRGVGDVDIVDADASAANDLEVGGGVENVLGHLGRGPDGKAVILADHGLQLFGGLAGDDVDLDAALTENGGGAGVHLVADKYLGHLYFLWKIVPSSPRRRGSISDRCTYR